MTDPIPGLEPQTGRLNTRYARWLGACKTCRNPILQATSTNGKPMPVDVHPTETGNLALTVEGGTLRARVTRYHPDKYMPHHASCEFANKNRKQRR